MAGASDMSRRDLERESGTEGGRGGDEGSLAKAPPSSSARAVFDAAECAAVEALRATTQAEQTFMSRFNLSPTGAASCASSPPAEGATAAAAVSARMSEASAAASGAPVAPAAGMHALAARAGQAARFKFADLLAATGNFEKQLGAGGSGSVFQGTLKSSATHIAVKKLEFAAGSEMQVALAHMQTEVQVLSQATHPNIVPLLGWSNDGEAPCLVYALATGGSLQDRLMCCENGVPLTSKERILVLSDVLRGLAYLHAEVRVIHRDVKSANVLIDHGCVGRIGDFGIARSVRDTCGVTATQLQTQAPMGTTIYMSPESVRGELSYKVDSFAFGLVMIETLTGLPLQQGAATCIPCLKKTWTRLRSFSNTWTREHAGNRTCQSVFPCCTVSLQGAWSPVRNAAPRWWTSFQSLKRCDATQRPWTPRAKGSRCMVRWATRRCPTPFAAPSCLKSCQTPSS